jgi:RNA polymerase sigma-70 factor (ECF subfamily)
MSSSKTTDRSRTAGPVSTSSGRAEDRALVDRCRQGELGAFEELYRAHSGRLFSLTLRMVGNAADAEDLLQDIFLAVHRKLETFRGDSALGTWMYRLATNVCLDHLRSRSARSSQVTEPLDDEPWIPDASSRGLAERTVTRMDLERALPLLPEGCRAAFVLHDIEGLEHSEVGEVLGIAEGTSKSQVHKARMRLRTLLAGG